MKICILGCGAIGGHLAVKMSLAGADVSVVARGAMLAAIRTNGLRLKTAAGRDWAVKIRAEEDPRALGPQDFVIVAVKTTALAQVATSIPPLLSAGTGVAFMINGLPWWLLQKLAGAGADNAWSPRVAAVIQALSPVSGPERIIGGIAGSANQVLEPGVIWNSSPHGAFTFGEPDHTLSARVRYLAGLVNQNDSVGIASPALADDIWKKLFMNVVTGPLGGLTGACSADIVEDAGLAPLVQQMGREMIAVAMASGCSTPATEYGYIKGIGKHKSSMLQDFEALRRPELDSLLGALVDLARIKRVAVPMLEMVLSLTRKRAQVLEIY
jgi:2-dehydropantoate 2-reductase